MFYEFSDVDDNLKCAFCRARFGDGGVKFIPDCGSSICDACYHELRTRTDATGYYACPACRGGQHLMPRQGLPDNRIALSLVKMRPSEKPMPVKARNLKAAVAELHDRLGRLRGLDRAREVNDYCDRLEAEVIEAAEEAMKRVTEQKANFVRKIGLYRSELLGQIRASSMTNTTGDASSQKMERELARLASEIDAFSRGWSSYYGQLRTEASEAEFEGALAEAAQFRQSIAHAEKRFRRHAFQHQFMQFTKNDLTNGCIFGKLDYLDEPDEKRTNGRRIDQKLVHKLNGHTCFVSQIVFLHNGNIASCSWDNTIKVWDQENGELLYELAGHANSVLALAQLPTGELASASADRTVKVWDLRARRLVRTLAGHTQWVISLLVLPDGRLASCSFDGTIKVWDLAYHDERSCLVRTMYGHDVSTWFMKMGLLSNGDLVTCSCEGDRPSVVRVWSPRDGRLVHSIATESSCAQALHVLSNDDVAVGFEDGSIRVINLNSVSKSKLLVGCHRGGVFSLAELPNGNLLSAGSDFDPSMRVWDPVEGKLLKTIATGHDKRVLSLSVSHTGDMLASGSSDKSIKLWSLTSNTNF